MALFLDVDGTLIEIAPRPDDVRVPTDLPATLFAVETRLAGALAILSGRTIAELDLLLQPVRLRAGGTHGAECRNDIALQPEILPPLPAPLVLAVQQISRDFPGTLFENKYSALAVHFRAVPQMQNAVRAALEDCLARYAHPRPDLMTGDMVFEIRVPGVDKGQALRRFMALAPFAGRRPFFVSDHPIDAAAFAAASALGGQAFSVGNRLPGTQGHFTGPAQVRAWLKDIAT